MIHDPSFNRLSDQEENYPSRAFRFLCEPDFWTDSNSFPSVCSQNVPSHFTKCLGNYFQCDEPKSHSELAFHLFLVEISQSTQIPGPKSQQIPKHTNHGEFLLCFRELKARISLTILHSNKLPAKQNEMHPLFFLSFYPEQSKSNLFASQLFLKILLSLSPLRGTLLTPLRVE